MTRGPRPFWNGIASRLVPSRVYHSSVTDVPHDKLEPLRLLAAKQRLGLILSEDIPPICDQLLKDGVYSPSLAELALNPEPIMSDVEPMLEKALAEVGIPSFSVDDAFSKVATDIAKRLACDDAPFSVLEECVAVERSEYFMGSLGAADRPKAKRACDFIWRCYGAHLDVTDFDPEFQPPQLSTEAARWDYLRPIMQQAARDWLAGKPIRE